MELIRHPVEIGDFVILPHAIERRTQRGISIPDIIYVLMKGQRDFVKDQYRFEFQTWNYAISGLTIDGRRLRVIVTFDSGQMLIVTVIRVGTRKQ